jgi:hypothetical protein
MFGSHRRRRILTDSLAPGNSACNLSLFGSDTNIVCQTLSHVGQSLVVADHDNKPGEVFDGGVFGSILI